MKSSCKGKNSCSGSSVFSATVHKQRINDSGTGLQPKLKDQIQRNLGGIIFACLCLAQISSGGLFFIIPAWIFAGVPAFLTAWLFYWYLNHLRFCWSVVACTALSAGSTQYIHGVFSIKGGRVPYCIGNYCHNLWRDACIGNAEGNFTDNADTTPRITSAKVVEHCQFCICRNAVWRLDVCSFAGY